MPIRISAKVDYKIEFQRSSLDDSSVNPLDIGFGITNVRRQRLDSKDIKDEAININAGKFLNDPASSPIINGKPNFITTLKDIGATPTLVLSGSPTTDSKEKEEFEDDESSILVDLVFVLPAQYYDPGKSFNLRLNMTISPK